MAKSTPKTELPPAPEPMPIAPVRVQPRQKTVERQGSKAEPYVHHYPQVRGGICEFCGVLDRNIPSEFQYKLCPHYRGLQLRCSYCDETKNPDEVIGHACLNIYGHPNDNDKLIVVCDALPCVSAHEKRFKNRN